MDRRRRRFVPGSENLEARKLQANVFGFAGTNIYYSPQPQLDTAVQQARRIKNLPHFLLQIEPNRYLSPTLTKQLQADLHAIQDKLPNRANSQILSNFNRQIRTALPHQNLTVGNSKALNYTFGQALLSTGASAEATLALQTDLNNMVKVDTQSPNPVLLATNDYSTILQTALAVGRFIQRPNTPMLSIHSALGGKANSNISISDTPLFVGTHHSGQIVRIVLSDGTVLAEAPTLANGRYHAQVHTPMPNGTYTVFAQATDIYGDISHLSFPFRLRVQVPKHRLKS